MYVSASTFVLAPAYNVSDVCTMQIAERRLPPGTILPTNFPRDVEEHPWLTSCADAPSSDPASFCMLRAGLVPRLGWLDARPTSLSHHAVSLSNLDNDWLHLSTKPASSSRVFPYVGGVTVMAAPDLGNGPYSEECMSAFSKSGDSPCAQSPRMHGACGQNIRLVELETMG